MRAPNEMSRPLGGHRCAALWSVAMAAAALLVAASEQNASPYCAVKIGFEPDPALPREVPAGLYRLLSRDSFRKDLPPFGRIGATDELSAEGGWSLRFALAGGAMAVASEPALLPAGEHEIVEAHVLVRADGLDRTEARLVVRALDGQITPIPEAEWSAHSQARAGWQRLSVRSGSAPAGTRSFEVAIEVRPRDAADPTGDSAGHVFFDELEIWRVPRLQVEIDRGGEGVGGAPQRIAVRVDDPIGQATTHGLLLDADGRERLSWQSLDEAHYEIDLLPIEVGAYEVVVEARSGARVLERWRRPLVVVDRAPAPPSAQVGASASASTSVPSDRRAAEGARFGFWIDRPGEFDRVALVRTLRLLRPHFVVIDLGEPVTEGGGRMSLPEVRRLVDDLRLESIETILRLGTMPEAIAASTHLERHDVSSLFLRSDASWTDSFGVWFERFGHVVQRWMISGAEIEQGVIERRLDGLVPGFIEVERSMAMVDTTPGGTRGEADRAARSLIERWRGGASLIALRGALPQEPGSAALALALLAASARGVESLAHLDSGGDLDCLLLSGPGTARVLAWRREGDQPAELVLPFDGESLAGHDLLGAPLALERSRGAVAASIGSTPVIIDGVDPTLGAFLARLRFDPPALEGSTAEQVLALHLDNPWDVTMEGTLRFVAPVDWSFVPRSRRFSLPPGSGGRIEVRTVLPRTQVTGSARIGVELEFTADRGYTLRIDPPIAIEVRDLACEATLRHVALSDGRQGAVVELLLANMSSRAMEIESIVSTSSGLARRDGPIRLEPEARARRTIRLDEPITGAVLLTVNQTNGPRRLVRSLP